MPFDNIMEYSESLGTGPMALDGAAFGYLAFGDRYVDGSQVYYGIVGTTATGVRTGQWEFGQGTISSGTLVRNTVHASSNADALVDFGYGTKSVFEAMTAEGIKALIQTTPGSRAGVKVLNSNTIVLDFTDKRVQTRAADGTVAISVSSYVADEEMVVIVTNTTGAPINIGAIVGWIWLTDPPTTLAAGKVGYLVLLSSTAAEGGCVAAWAVQA